MANKSLEVRINSVADAKSVVRNQSDILNKKKVNGCDSIKFIIAKEVESEVNAIIYGVFRCQTFTSKVSCLPENTLYQLPHYTEKPVEIPIRQTTMKVDKIPVLENLTTTQKSIQSVIKDAETARMMISPLAEPKKYKGRKPGSKNKPKPVEATQ